MCYNSQINSHGNYVRYGLPCQRFHDLFFIWYCFIALKHKSSEKDLTSQDISQNIAKLTEGVSDEGKRDVLIFGIVNRADNYNTKDQKESYILSKMELRKT